MGELNKKAELALKRRKQMEIIDQPFDADAFHAATDREFAGVVFHGAEDGGTTIIFDVGAKRLELALDNTGEYTIFMVTSNSMRRAENAEDSAKAFQWLGTKEGTE